MELRQFSLSFAACAARTLKPGQGYVKIIDFGAPGSAGTVSFRSASPKPISIGETSTPPVTFFGFTPLFYGMYQQVYVGVPEEAIPSLLELDENVWETFADPPHFTVRTVPQHVFSGQFRNMLPSKIDCSIFQGLAIVGVDVQVTGICWNESYGSRTAPGGLFKLMQDRRAPEQQLSEKTVQLRENRAAPCRGLFVLLAARRKLTSISRVQFGYLARHPKLEGLGWPSKLPRLTLSESACIVTRRTGMTSCTQGLKKAWRQREPNIHCRWDPGHLSPEMLLWWKWAQGCSHLEVGLSAHFQIL